METNLKNFITKELAIKYVDDNYHILASSPRLFIKNIKRIEITKFSDGLIVIVDEYGVLI